MSNRCCPNNSQPDTSRRQFLKSAALRTNALGFGNLALGALLHDTAVANPTASKQTHHPAKAKRIIFLFMKGGPSHVDTFDYKPQLQKDDGKELPYNKPRVQFGETSKLMGSPWKFRPHGESGIMVSELFPHVGNRIDDICLLNSVHGTNAAHGGALLKLHTGSDNFVRPSMGSWVTYGLGTENQNLPSFVTICPTLAHGGVKNWSSAFLPAKFQGTPLGVASQPATSAEVAYTHNKRITRKQQRLQLDLIKQANQEHLKLTGPNQALEGRIGSFELAFRMQSRVPEIVDIADESKQTLAMYGLDEEVTKDFGRQCILARRFAEAGVRFIQITHSDSNVQWDQHGDLVKGHTKNALEVDKPIAALLTDLKQRGLLEDTLVLWGGEFGRTPVMQGSNGRDHNPEGFTMWMAGGGVKGGYQYGTTDEYGYFAQTDKMHVNDLHATLLHLVGLNHLNLTYRYAGRDFRLTDVAGKVATGIFV